MATDVSIFFLDHNHNRMHVGPLLFNALILLLPPLLSDCESLIKKWHKCQWKSTPKTILNDGIRLFIHFIMIHFYFVEIIWVIFFFFYFFFHDWDDPKCQTKTHQNCLFIRFWMIIFIFFNKSMMETMRAERMIRSVTIVACFVLVFDSIQDFHRVRQPKGTSSTRGNSAVPVAEPNRCCCHGNPPPKGVTGLDPPG